MCIAIVKLTELKSKKKLGFQMMNVIPEPCGISVVHDKRQCSVVQTSSVSISSCSVSSNMSYLYSFAQLTATLEAPNTNSYSSVSHELSYRNNSMKRSVAYLTKIKQLLKTESYSMFNFT